MTLPDSPLDLAEAELVRRTARRAKKSHPVMKVSGRGMKRFAKKPAQPGR